jgi:ACS family tartrate transporter-like MFS transporter
MANTTVRLTAAEKMGAADDVFRKVAWRLIPFMILLYFVAFLDRINIGIAALTMNKDLGISATAYGNAAGIFFLGYFLFEVPSNIMLEKVGARRWIARIMVTWGLLSAGMTFVQGETSLFVIRFLLGAAEAGFFPGMILYLTYWFPASTRAKITGAFLVAIPLSSVLGAPVSSAILDLEGFGLRGWQWLFLIEGIPAILLGFVVLKYLTDKPADAEWLSPSERQIVSNRIAAEAAHGGEKHSLAAGLVSLKVWLFGLIYFGIVIGVYGMSLWLPQIVKGFGELSNQQVGLITAIPHAFGAVAMVIWGRHSDKAGERVWHMALAAFAGAGGLVASAFLASAPIVALSAMTFAAIGIYSALPVFWTLPTAMLRGTAAAGGIALINSLGNLSGYLGPSMVGYLKDQTGSFQSGLIMLGGFLAMAGLLVFAVTRNRAPERSS